MESTRTHKYIFSFHIHIDTHTHTHTHTHTDTHTHTHTHTHTLHSHANIQTYTHQTAAGRGRGRPRAGAQWCTLPPTRRRCWQPRPALLQPAQHHRRVCLRSLGRCHQGPRLCCCCGCQSPLPRRCQPWQLRAPCRSRVHRSALRTRTESVEKRPAKMSKQENHDKRDNTTVRKSHREWSARRLLFTPSAPACPRDRSSSASQARRTGAPLSAVSEKQRDREIERGWGGGRDRE